MLASVAGCSLNKGAKMCKILVMPSITPETEDNAQKFMKAMAKKMTPGNNDGLGYAAFDGEGNMFGERWLRNYEAFREREEVTEFDKWLIEHHRNFVNKEDKYNRFGVIKENNWRSAVLHTRYATSGKAFIQTHPHVYKDTALIHNGIVATSKSDKLRSGCDSEKILNLYLKHNVANNISNIKKVTMSLDGYFACAVLAKTKDGMPILDVFKESVSSLHAAFIKELGTMVFSTSATDLKEVCKDLHFTIVSFYNVKDNRLIRFNALTGTVIGMRKFKVKESRKHYGHYGPYGSMAHPYSDDWATEGMPGHWWRDSAYGTDSNGQYPSTYEEVLEAEEGGPTKGNDDGMTKKNENAVLRLARGINDENDGWIYNENSKVWYKDTK